MTDPSINPLSAAKPRPAWRRTAVWVAALAVVYSGLLLSARLLVSYRFGGPFLSPYFLLLFAGSLGLVLALWPLLAVTSTDPVRSDLIKSVLQWTVIGCLAFGVLYVIGQGLDDSDLNLIAGYVGKDLVLSPSLHAK